MPEESSWDRRILDAMEPGAATFGWDDGEVQTIQAPRDALTEMKSAWAWIDERLREFEKTKGRPRSVCFRLSNGQFRGLTFPDWQPGALADKDMGVLR
jgi:hypothetical protein